MTRRAITVAFWAILTTAAIGWLSLGNLTGNRFGSSVLIIVAFSMGFGVAKVIAWRRIDRENPLLPKVVPLRITSAVGGVVMFGPVLAYAVEWLGIWPAVAGFLGGLVMLLIGTALFSDGYQTYWVDSLIFFGRLAPPEDDYLLVRDANREAGRRKWSSEDGASE